MEVRKPEPPDPIYYVYRGSWGLGTRQAPPPAKHREKLTQTFMHFDDTVAHDDNISLNDNLP